MGMVGATREEKLKSMRTSHTRKLTRKLNKLGKNKKISRNVVDSLKDIKARKSKDSRKRALNVEDDWVADRERQIANEEYEEVLPLDMLDADIDWENSAFAKSKRRFDEDQASDEEDDGVGIKKRKFEGSLDDDAEEMLPIKLQDGTLIRPTRKKEQEEEEDDEENKEEEPEEITEAQEDYSQLSASELLKKRKELLEDKKLLISGYCHQLLGNPQEHVYKLRELFNLCLGKGVHSLIRETVQKLAIASMVQVFVDIIPGYAIRPITDEERDQKLKKETKKLQEYEESLLRYYLKFLQLCEKLAKKFEDNKKKLDESTFSYKIGMIGIKALARLMTCCSHFNYTTNIISTMVRLSVSRNKSVVSEVCGAIAKLFKEDIHLKMSLFGARSISTLVTKLKGRVTPELMSTLISLNIREVNKGDKKSGKTKIFAQRARVKKEKANKTARKYKKQLDKLEADLKELDAAEIISNKLALATEAMKYVFQTYFSVLKRMPTLTLLEPTLEGLCKFAHLLNVEFFEDIIQTMEDLVDKQHLRLIDQIYCINTVFTILSGDGQLLNVDPSKFYRSIYRLLNEIPFEHKAETRLKLIVVATKTLDIMLNERRKQVPLPRVAAFVKRILSICTILDDRSALCLVAFVRTLFITHPKLISMTEEDEAGGGAGGITRLDINDPDVSNALGSDVRLELRMLMKRRHKYVHHIAQNIIHGVPSTGQMRLSPQITSVKAWQVLEQDIQENGPYDKVEMKYLNDLQKHCKKVGQTLSSANLVFHLGNWLETRPF